MFLRDIEENRPRKSLTTDPATSYNGSNYFNETEKCSDWEEYLATGCREETDGGSFREGGWELAHEQRTERVLFHRGSKM